MPPERAEAGNCEFSGMSGRVGHGAGPKLENQPPVPQTMGILHFKFCLYFTENHLSLEGPEEMNVSSFM